MTSQTKPVELSMDDLVDMEDCEQHILDIMKECNIDFYLVKTTIANGHLTDTMYVHTIGEPVQQLTTANKYVSPMFKRLKQLEILVKGQTS